jgi:acyl-CoA thioester hydrolase
MKSKAQSSEFREGYRCFIDITTRWMDNDMYGHVNNVTYYSHFDTAANQSEALLRQPCRIA